MDVATLFLKGAGSSFSAAPVRAGLARGGGRTAGFALSFAAHAAVFAYAVYHLDNASLGAASPPSEAISIELAASSVIESVSAAEAPAAAAQEPVAATEGNAEADQKAAAEAEPAPSPPTLQPPSETPDVVKPVVPDDVPVTGMVMTTPTESIAREDTPAPKPAVKTKTDEKPRKHVEKPKERKKPDETRERASEAKRRGAKSARGKDTARTSGRASASPGQVQNYAARVRAKVAGNKPPGNGARGTAVVSFGVSSAGGLSFARLARSSGSPPLDRAAISAVRRAAPFGPTPSGSSLTFAVPFHFQ